MLLTLLLLLLLLLQALRMVLLTLTMHWGLTAWSLVRKRRKARRVRGAKQQ
jgi:hypothetical protein